MHVYGVPQYIIGVKRFTYFAQLHKIIFNLTTLYLNNEIATQTTSLYIYQISHAYNGLVKFVRTASQNTIVYKVHNRSHVTNFGISHLKTSICDLLELL